MKVVVRVDLGGFSDGRATCPFAFGDLRQRRWLSVDREGTRGDENDAPDSHPSTHDPSLLSLGGLYVLRCLPAKVANP